MIDFNNNSGDCEGIPYMETSKTESGGIFIYKVKKKLMVIPIKRCKSTN